MLKLLEKNITCPEPDGYLTLRFEQRIKSRLKVTLDDGREAGIFLERGQILKNGDCLRADNGEWIQVLAAPETVSTVQCDDPLLLARACYHLGNRHVPLQITSTWLRYQHDHVLDELLRGLGLTVATEQAPFEPEPGAYGGTTHRHTHTGHSHH